MQPRIQGPFAALLVGTFACARPAAVPGTSPAVEREIPEDPVQDGLTVVVTDTSGSPAADMIVGWRGSADTRPRELATTDPDGRATLHPDPLEVVLVTAGSSAQAIVNYQSSATRETVALMGPAPATLALRHDGSGVTTDLLHWPAGEANHEAAGAIDELVAAARGDDADALPELVERQWATIRAIEDPKRRALVAIHYFTYAAQAVGPGRFEDLMAIASPESPAWAVQSPYLPELLWVIGDEARPLAQALREHHDDPGLRSVLLGWELSQAAKAGDGDTIATLYRELEQPQYAATIAWRNARKHDPDRAIAIGKPLPDFSVVRLDSPNEPLNRTDLVGKAWVIHVWTTWCSPCVEELDALPELYRKRPGGEAVEFLAISLDDERALSEHTLDDHPIEWPSTWSEDGEALMRAWGFSGVPLTLLVDDRGTIVHVWDGKASNRAIDTQLSMLLSASNP